MLFCISSTVIKNGALETPSFSYGEENAPFTSFLYIF